ncbi:MAG: FliM/FliN family flagellar motor switch protein [Firmicutes bacterium]|nr:FliM/FliN family flagellar motor switch protein [Bacillota bacterium]
MTASFLSQDEIDKLLSRLNSEVTDKRQGEEVAKPQCSPPPVAAQTPVAPEREAPPQAMERVSFPELQEARVAGQNSLELFYDTPVTLTMELGSAEMKVREVLALQKSSVIKLDRLAGENVVLLVNGRVLASGEVVVINESFGFRVTAVGDAVRETAEKG